MLLLDGVGKERGARCLHVDSSHSGLISRNSRGLAGARSVQEGVIIKKRGQVQTNGLCSLTAAWWRGHGWGRKIVGF